MCDALRRLAAKLASDNREIGNRPFSACEKHGRDWFVDTVCRLETIRWVCSKAFGEAPWNELAPDEIERAEAIIDRVDRYGTLLEDWDGRAADLRQRLRQWARVHCPSDLWTRGSSAGSLPKFVDRLMAAVKAAADGYTAAFEPDFLIWIRPVLRRTVLDEWTRRFAPPLDRKRLLSCAQALLEIARTHGIDATGVVPLDKEDGSPEGTLPDEDRRAAEQIVEAALFTLIRNPVDDDIERDALAAVVNQVKNRSLCRWNVVDPDRRDADAIATAKSRELLCVFAEYTNKRAEPGPRLPRNESPSDSLLRALASRYGSLSEGRRRLDRIRLTIEQQYQMADEAVSDRDEAIERLVKEALIAERVPQRSDPNDQWHLGGINEREAIALWLGWRRNEAVSASGLWRFYEDMLPKISRVPEVITQLFQPRSHDGDEQSYVDACRLMIEAYGRGRMGRLPLPLDEAHRRVAWMLSDYPPAPTGGDQKLVLVLSIALGVKVGGRTVRESVGELCRCVLYGQDAVLPDDATKRIAAWVTGTLHGEERRDPVSLAARLKGNAEEVKEATNEVSQLWLKGTNTLKHKYLARVFSAIDAYAPPKVQD
jgi:hypothetical protein